MDRRTVTLLGVLIVLTLTLGTLTMALPWYKMDADGEAFFRTRNNRGDRDAGEPTYDDYTLSVQLLGGTEAGGINHLTFDPDEGARIDLTVVPAGILWLLGFGASALTLIGLAVRAHGVPNRGTMVAGLAIVAAFCLTYSLTLFAVGIPTAINEELEDRYGEGPQIALFTRDGPSTPSDSGLWEGVNSGPGLGWWAGLGTVISLLGATFLAFQTDLRSFSERLHELEASGAAPTGGRHPGTGQRDASTSPGYRIGRERGPDGSPLRGGGGAR